MFSSGQRTGFTVVNRALHLALWQNGTIRGDNRDLAGSEIQNEIQTKRNTQAKYTVKENCLSQEGASGSK